jgi:hypothetical protein
MILKVTEKGIRYTLTNEGLAVGDETFPISEGKVVDGKYVHEGLCLARYGGGKYDELMCGLPNDPHIILDLHHDTYKPYEVRTNHGYGPVEHYFKIVEQFPVIDMYVYERPENNLNNYLKPMNGERFALTKCSHMNFQLYDKMFMQMSIMSNDDYEKENNLRVIREARGDVLIAGLGIGLIVLPIMNKPEVTSVDVLELHQEVIDMIKPQLPLNEKVRIILANAYSFVPRRKYDLIYYDTVNDDFCTDSELELRRIRGKIVGYDGFEREFSKHLNPGGTMLHFG